MKVAETLGSGAVFSAGFSEPPENHVNWAAVMVPTAALTGYDFHGHGFLIVAVASHGARVR